MSDFIICEMHGFSHQRLIAWENAMRSIELGDPGKLVPIFPESMVTFLPSDSYLMVYFITEKKLDFCHQFLIVRKNATKSTL